MIPEDIRDLVEYTIPHRVIFKEEYENLNKREVIRSIVNTVPTPL